MIFTVKELGPYFWLGAVIFVIFLLWVFFGRTPGVNINKNNDTTNSKTWTDIKPDKIFSDNLYTDLRNIRSHETDSINNNIQTDTISFRDTKSITDSVNMNSVPDNVHHVLQNKLKENTQNIKINGTHDDYTKLNDVTNLDTTNDKSYRHDLYDYVYNEDIPSNITETNITASNVTVSDDNHSYFKDKHNTDFSHDHHIDFSDISKNDIPNYTKFIDDKNYDVAYVKEDQTYISDPYESSEIFRKTYYNSDYSNIQVHQPEDVDMYPKSNNVKLSNKKDAHVEQLIYTEDNTKNITSDDNILENIKTSNKGKKKNKNAGKFISKGERECCQTMEKIYGVPFVSVRPDWLKNPETGENLELDCYNDDLKIAVEYNGIQHYKWPNFTNQTYQQFINQVRRDMFKSEMCKKNDVYLISVPYHVNHKAIAKYLMNALPETISKQNNV